MDVDRKLTAFMYRFCYSASSDSLRPPQVIEMTCNNVSVLNWYRNSHCIVPLLLGSSEKSNVDSCTFVVMQMATSVISITNVKSSRSYHQLVTSAV